MNVSAKALHVRDSQSRDFVLCWRKCDIMFEGSVSDTTTENESKIPKGWKAVALFAIFAFAILCTAGVIVGYGQLYPALIASKVFYNLCNTSNASYSYQPFNHTCEKQDAALGKMFNLAASMNIFVQAFGGVLLDFAGPKLTFLFAMALLLPGTILFAFSSPNFDYYFLRYIALLSVILYCSLRVSSW